ncbi:uncharacterized protein LOC143206606 [Rhynchophorus ferrugineus]|uniref:Protein quiver n=1 Tax=Rhynchophorus ferrugineus TaxID=354439 RepID=A0A834IEH2_RHYFE|nr:hypothetical protein GWI33_007351 [Rhynchophorus ferrugineus]
MDVLLFLLFISLNLVPGEGILCYHCHQTSKECNYGLVDYIHQKNCTENKCATMKYETPMPGRNVLATIRDCATHSAEELLEKSSMHSPKKAKIIFHDVCSKPLCNTSLVIKHCHIFINIALIFFLFGIR